MENNTVKTNIWSVIPYLPFRILKKLATEEGHQFRRIEQLRGAVIYVDVAGFTSLTITLAQRGQHGVEEMQLMLSRYFYTELIRTIREFGGSVYQFAGDSVMAGMNRIEEETDADCGARAVKCAQAIQKWLMEKPAIENLGTFKLAAKVAVCFGDYFQILLGNLDTSLTCAIVGFPVESAGQAEKHAAGGDIILDKKMWDLLGPEKKGSPINDFYRFESGLDNKPIKKFDLTIDDKKFDSELLKRCSSFINPVIYNKIIGGHHSFFGDFREVTCVFIMFDGLDYVNSPEQSVKNLNEFLIFVTEQSRTYGEILIQTDFSDKNVFFALFGAPTAIENKENLACHFALKLLEAKDNFSFIKVLRIGIATGFTYCGDLGAPFRKGYTVVGETINLAARLMSYGQTSGVNIDSNTEPKLRKRYVLKMINDVAFKGIDKNKTIFRLESEIKRFRGILVHYNDKLVGRRQELDSLRGLLEKSINTAGQICLISGEAGIGKSRLTGAFLDEIEKYDAEPLVGYCYSYEKFTPFFPWKELLLLFFQIFDHETLQDKLSKMEKEFNNLKDVNSAWMAVLSGILGITVEENLFIRNLDPRQKNERIFQIIFQLLEKRALETPLVLYFEDTHWADEISLNLIHYIAERIKDIPAMILLVTRPTENFIKLSGLENHFEIKLSEMGETDARDFLGLKMKLELPDEHLENIILSRSQGNPFFMESIVQNLKEQSYLKDAGGGKYRAMNAISDITIPNTLQDVLLSRIDRLQETQKMIIKTASAIGRIFPYDVLHELTSEISKPDLNENLDSLRRLDLTPLESEDPLAYIFKHIVIRDVAYKSMLLTTRVDLHRRLAGILEVKSKEKLNEAAGILAFHFLAGNNEEKGLFYTLMAARKAKAQYANRDAIHHYTKVRELLKPENEELKATFFQATEELAQVNRQAGNYEESITLFEECLVYHKTNLRRAELHSGLGQVYQERGESERAIAEMETALKLTGRLAPTYKALTVLFLLGQVLIKVGHAMFPSLIRNLSEAKNARCQMQSTILSSLMKTYFFVDIDKLAWAGFAHLNVAERMRSDSELSLSSSNFGTMLQTIGMLELARKQFEKGILLAEKVKDPMVEAFAFIRRGLRGFYINEPECLIEDETRAINIFRQIGEMWELLTALSIKATGYYYKSMFAVHDEMYDEIGALSRQLGSSMHLSWKYAWAALSRYLIGSDDIKTIKDDLQKGLKISIENKDLYTQCVALMHMAIVSVRENEPDAAALLAVEANRVIRNYKVFLPHSAMAFVHAAEAALFALESGHVSKSQNRKLIKIVKQGYKMGLKLGKTFPYLLGPGLRIQARYFAFINRPEKADLIFIRAIQVLKTGPNRWETGVAYLDAAMCLPHRRDEYLPEARSIFEEYNIKAELRRIDKLSQYQEKRF